MQNIGIRLEGWKAIAGYLGVSIRTAQSFEKEHGMPVVRGPGVKSPVYAESGALDLWKARTANPSREALPQALPARSTRRGWLGGVIAALGLGAAGFGFGRRVFLAPMRPIAYRVEGATLMVFGQDNVELWRHTFPMQIPNYMGPDQPNPPCIFADVDGDGKLETLFRYRQGGWDALCNLCCFDNNGSLRWEFTPGKKVVDIQNRDFHPPFWAAAFTVVRPEPGRSPVVVLSSNHNWSFPDQVAVLDGDTGKLLSEYWHRGHLLRIAAANLDGSGRPSVLLGGVNDAPEFKLATLVIFDRCRIFGSSRNPKGESYFRGMGAGPERVVLFPRTPVNRDQEFNRVTQLFVSGGRITVVVAEGIDEQSAPQVIYELSLGLKPLRVSFEGRFFERYRVLQESGKVRQSLDELAQTLIHGVRVIG